MTAAELGHGLVVFAARAWRPVLALAGAVLFLAAVAEASPVVAQGLAGLLVVLLAVGKPALLLLRRRT